jgi:hypothetical protein
MLLAPHAGTSGPHTPLLAEEAQRLTFAASDALPAALEAHLRSLHEADVILRLQARAPAGICTAIDIFLAPLLVHTE